MSSPTQVRRADKLMPDERVLEMISSAYAGRLASVGPDGWPYIVPLLYVRNTATRIGSVRRASIHGSIR